MLDIHNLSVEIGSTKIIDGLNLSIGSGEVHALMGANGTGKSTLAKAIAGSFDCTVLNGRIDYLGSDLLPRLVEERANLGIFLSFQNPVEIPGLNNIYFLKTALNEKRKYHGLSELDSVAFLKIVNEKLSQLGIDSSILERNVNDGFSGGEKKRNEILQMLVLEPQLIMLDEIDSGLDVDALKSVAGAVNSLRDENRSFLLITHYSRLLELIKPDFIHILSGGKIIKTGDASMVETVEKYGYDFFKPKKGL